MTVLTMGGGTAGAAEAGAGTVTVTPPAVQAPKLALTRSVLPNGLEVLVVEDHRAPLVAVNLWYHVASKDDPAGKSGFAHLFEHLMFQGSRHVPEDTFFQFLERAGATEVNGTTNTDRTNYFETVPSHRLELALWLESDRMAYLLDHVDAATFASQRDVVKNEYRVNYANAPYGLVGHMVNAALYPANHPYARLTIGKPEDLDAASLDDVKAFFRAWYVPNNASLVIAGDVAPEAARALAEKYFAPIPKATPLPTRAEVPPVHPDGDVRLAIEAGVELPLVRITWPTPRAFAPGDAELDVLSRVLAHGENSRLHRRLVRELRVAESVFVQQSSQDLGSELSIDVRLHPGRSLAEALKVVDDELAVIRKEPVSEGELSRAKTTLLADLLFQAESVGGQANLVNWYAQSTGDPAYMAKNFARYAAVTAESVRDTAARTLPTSSRVVALVTPKAGAPLAGRLVSTTKAAPEVKR